MRRDRSPRPRSFFGTSEWFRMGSMIMMLIIVFALILRLRDPDVIRAIGAVLDPGPAAQEKPAPAQPPPGVSEVKGGQAAPAPAAKDAPAEAPGEAELQGPTDLEPEQIEEFRREAAALSDRTEAIKPEEMFAYNRMLVWVYSQSAAEMRKRARTDLEYNDLIQSPEKYRGQLVEMELNARLVRKWEAGDRDDMPKYPTPLYEVWGPAPDSGAFLYCAVVVNLPQEMPTGKHINERIRLVGYYLKVQGYKDAMTKFNVAPLLLGRMVWIRPDPQAAAAPKGLGKWTGGLSEWAFWAGLVGLGAVAATVAWLAAGKRRRPRIREIPRPQGAAGAEWLDGPAPVPIDDNDSAPRSDSPDPIGGPAAGADGKHGE